MEMARRMYRRRALLCAAGVVSMMAGLPALAQADFPARPVRIVVPYPAAGPTDSLARLLAQRLSLLWKVAVVVENRPGASGTIGSQNIATARPDGYSLLLTAGAATGSSEVLNPAATPYRALRDFTPLAFLGVQPTLMVVQASMPVNDVKEFVALARANPGKFNYGNSSAGSAGHFAFNMLKLVTGIDVVEIPFAGSAPSNLAFAQGEVHTIMGSLLSITPNLQTGKAKPIGVASAERMEGFPNVPTFREQGIPVEWDTWYGMVAPANLPRDLVAKISADMLSVMDGEEVRTSMNRMGIVRRLGGPERLRDALRTEVENATRVAREAKMVKE